MWATAALMLRSPRAMMQYLGTCKNVVLKLIYGVIKDTLCFSNYFVN
jgi:hypothetical protein